MVDALAAMWVADSGVPMGSKPVEFVAVLGLYGLTASGA